MFFHLWNARVHFKHLLITPLQNASMRESPFQRNSTTRPSIKWVWWQMTIKVKKPTWTNYSHEVKPGLASSDGFPKKLACRFMIFHDVRFMSVLFRRWKGEERKEKEEGRRCDRINRTLRVWDFFLVASCCSNHGQYFSIYTCWGFIKCFYW